MDSRVTAFSPSFWTHRISMLRTTILLALASLLFVMGCDTFGTDETNDDDATPTVSVYAEGLTAPIGIEVDAQGRLWVGEQGTGNDDSRLSVITPDGQVHPFLAGFPSEIIQGDPLGVQRAYFSPSGDDLFILQGEGTDALSMHLLRADPSGFTPGDPPLSVGDIEDVADIGRFVLSDDFDFATSNPYAMAFGPENDPFIVDAGANAIIRRDRSTGELSVFARFDDVQNPTDVGPPMTDAVPTDVIFRDGRFYVSTLTGFPFPEGQARIYEVDQQGNVSVLEDGFTALVDLAVDPRDGSLLALQIARPGQEGFQPNTGQLLKVENSTTDTLVTDLNLSSGMHVGTESNVFVSSLADGEILQIDLP
jgi:sugar lactone lactonase YvrE